MTRQRRKQLEDRYGIGGEKVNTSESRNGFMWHLMTVLSWVLLAIAVMAVISLDSLFAIWLWLIVGVISVAWLSYSGAFESKVEVKHEQ